MESLQNDIQSLSEFLQKLYGLPAPVLIVASCFVLGFLLKRVPKFPNAAIPFMVVLAGMILNPLIASSQDNLFDDLPRVWQIKCTLIGGLYGFAEWVFHNQIYKRIFAGTPTDNPGTDAGTIAGTTKP